MKTRIKQPHNHDPAQLALGDTTEQKTAVARRTDPPTSHAAAASVTNLRASHRRVIQLFRTYGPMTDAEALEAAISDGWHVSPSGLRSRRSEVTPPRGRGIRDSGKKRKSEFGQEAVVWELDPTAEEAERFRYSGL